MTSHTPRTIRDTQWTHWRIYCRIVEAVKRGEATNLRHPPDSLNQWTFEFDLPGGLTVHMFCGTSLFLRPSPFHNPCITNGTRRLRRALLRQGFHLPGWEPPVTNWRTV